jgi:hypothetical protein
VVATVVFFADVGFAVRFVVVAFSEVTIIIGLEVVGTVVTTVVVASVFSSVAAVTSAAVVVASATVVVASASFSATVVVVTTVSTVVVAVPSPASPQAHNENTISSDKSNAKIALTFIFFRITYSFFLHNL